MRNREKEAIRKGRIKWFKRNPPLKFTGRKALAGQWRVMGLWIDDGKWEDPYMESRHERFNFNNSRKYPHSSLDQQIRVLKRPDLGGVVEIDYEL